MNKVESFEPIIDPSARVLILGSMPGVQSLHEQRYYANPNNHFWSIIYAVFSMPIEVEYEKRIQFLRDKRIALWDVIKSCDRVGSLDTNIKDETVNDFEQLFACYPSLKLIVFNGQKAFATYKKHVGFDLLEAEYLSLPSTSPANTMKFENKLEQWKLILEYV